MAVNHFRHVLSAPLRAVRAGNGPHPSLAALPGMKRRPLPSCLSCMLCMQKNSLDSFLGSIWKPMSGIRNRFVFSVPEQVHFSSVLTSNHLLWKVSRQPPTPAPLPALFETVSLWWPVTLTLLLSCLFPSVGILGVSPTQPLYFFNSIMSHQAALKPKCLLFSSLSLSILGRQGKQSKVGNIVVVEFWAFDTGAFAIWASYKSAVSLDASDHFP